MALPIIRIHHTGSDNNSGAGPGDGVTTGPLLSGTTNASFSGATVTLPAGTDLTNVLTTGAHVIYIVTSTGVRFFKITAKAGSGGATPTVDVTPNPAGTSTARTWSIGGVRASLGSTTSRLLFDNGGAAGDAMPGWIIEFQDAHFEAWPAGYSMTIYRDGDTTDGRIILRTAPGFTTKAEIQISTTSSSTASAIETRQYKEVRDIKFTRDGTGTNGWYSALYLGWGGNNCVGVTASGIEVIGLAANHFYGSIGVANNAFGVRIEKCRIEYADVYLGFQGHGTIEGCVIENCYWGIYVAAYAGGVQIKNNIISGTTVPGIYLLEAGGACTVLIENNTFYDSASHGIDIASVTHWMTIQNNQIVNNGGYGINSADGTIKLNATSVIRNNNTYGNSSGAYSFSGVATDDPGLDPDFVDPANGDFTPQEPLMLVGFPTTFP